MTKLFVIPGHGAGDPGAVGNGYREADQVRALATRMKALGGDAVTLADFSRNYYADGGINSLSLGTEWQIIELHMDSSDSSSARGGHVIIYSAFEPDAFDNALAAFIGGFFPGRSVIIAKRDDLANPSRAASRGIGYRLLECCFISNAADAGKFASQMDALATGILAAFGIGADAGAAPAPSQPETGGTVDLYALADAVIAGQYGNGDERRAALGSNYDAVQAIVNERLGGGSSGGSVDVDALARRTIAGEFGNGDARAQALGENYAAVQARVNEMLGQGGGGSDIDALARAVIRGDYGNGDERKQRLGADYDAVQARVNELM